MSVVGKRIEEALQVLMEQGVVTDAVIELFKLTRRRELTINQQPGNLEECRVLSDIINGVATVAKNPLITVDKRDSAGSRSRIDEPVVESRVAGLLGQARDVDAGSAVHGRDNRKLCCSTRKVQ
jgi:hypothetical protein